MVLDAALPAGSQHTRMSHVLSLEIAVHSVMSAVYESSSHSLQSGRCCWLPDSRPLLLSPGSDC